MNQEKPSSQAESRSWLRNLLIWGLLIAVPAYKAWLPPSVIGLLIISALSIELPALREEKYSLLRKVLIYLPLLAVVVIMGWVKAIIAALIIIGIIATIHEFGHYLASKAVGVRVDEFSVGLGSTKLWVRKIGETEYSIRPIPLGAFVKPAGMDPEEEYEDGDDPGERSFNKKNLLAKLAILLAGPLSNIFLTVVIMSGLYFVVGDRPTTIEVDKVLRGKPAALAGIRSGDRFLEIDGKKIRDYIEGIDIIGRNAGKKIKVKIDRPYKTEDGETIYKEIELFVEPELTEDGVGKIGMLVGPYVIDKTYVPLPFTQACFKGLQKTLGYVYKMYHLTLRMFKRAFSKMEVPAQIGGPLKIVDTIKDSVAERFDIKEILSLTAWLSMSIGVFNLLPIPALDGGRILVLLVAWVLKLVYIVLRRPIPKEGVISPQLEEIVHFLGFAFLILLLIIVSWKDIRDLIAPPSKWDILKVKKEECIDGLPSSKTTTAPSAGVTPGTSATGTPGTSATGTPGTSATGTPGTSATGTPGTSVTGTPGTSATGTPGTSSGVTSSPAKP